MDTVTGWKLFRQRRDGSLGPLFINRRQRLEVGVPMQPRITPRRAMHTDPGGTCVRNVLHPISVRQGACGCEFKLVALLRISVPLRRVVCGSRLRK